MRGSRFDSVPERGLPEEGCAKVKFHREVWRGKVNLRAENPNPEDDRRYLIEPWLSQVEIGEALIAATIAVLSIEKKSTRNATHCDLRYGFIAFLNETRPKAYLEDLNTVTFQHFIQWLDAVGNGRAKARGYYDKLHKLSALKKLIWRLSPQLSTLGVDHEIPVNPWPGQCTNRGKGKDTISIDNFVDLLAAAIDAYRETIGEIDPLLSKIDKMLTSHSSARGEDTSTVEGLCSTVILRYDGMLPDREWLKKNDVDTFDEVQRLGYTRIARIINPKVNDHIPAFIILQCFTHWNEQPLCCLNLANIDKSAGILNNKYKLSSYKGRARKMVFRSFSKGPEIFNPCNIVEFIERWTRYIRAYAPKRIESDLFLYVSKFKRRKVGAVRSLAQASRGLYGLTLERKSKFFRERGLATTGGNALRQAGSDYLRELLNDSDKVKTLLGHSSVATTDGSYRSSWAQRRDEVSLAGAMAMKERHQESAGKVDPRGHYGDRSAATPGYSCLDPFQSPIVGQIPGRMCSAYGLCPACPLRAMRTDVASWGRRIQLHQRYEEAARTMGTARFNERYGEASKALAVSLARLTDADLDQVSRLVLNPIPVLE